MLTVDDYLATPPVAPDMRAAYGHGPEQFGELYLPPGPGPHPVVILIHGGCWRAQYGLAPLGALCAALRGEGFAVWSLEYRRIGNGGGWPTTFADVAAGTDALRTLHTPPNGSPLSRGEGWGEGAGAVSRALDLTRIIAAGHSAGGHLALWLAARKHLPRSSPLWSPAPLPIRGVLALAALADLDGAAQRSLCGTAVPELLGGGPEEQPARYAEASPAALLPLGVPQRHLVGAHDAIVPPDYLAAYVAAAQAAGDDARLDVLPDAGHFEVVSPHSAAWLTVLTAARALAR